jgi:hypothetical protein
MKEKDKISFSSAIEQRKNSYSAFSSIFTKMFTQILKEDTIHDIQLPYEAFFAQIETFIDKNDHYDSESTISQQ